MKSSLKTTELIEVLKTENKDRIFICGEIDKKDKIIDLWNGNGKKFSIPFSFFTDKVVKPNFNDFEIIDYGQTIRLGKFECSSWAIIFENNCEKIAKNIIENMQNKTSEEIKSIIKEEIYSNVGKLRYKWKN